MRLGEQNCYYYVIYTGPEGYRTDLMSLKSARGYAKLFDGVVHIHSSASWWHRFWWNRQVWA